MLYIFILLKHFQGCKQHVQAREAVNAMCTSLTCQGGASGGKKVEKKLNLLIAQFFENASTDSRGYSRFARPNADCEQVVW